jgi:hypothetical protein
MDVEDTLANVIAYPALITPALTSQLFENSERVRGVTNTIWWQVLVDQKQKKSRGGNAQEWVDLDYTLSVECEKRLMLFEEDNTTLPEPVVYRTRNYEYNIFVPGLMQVNKNTNKRRPVRRLAVTHDSEPVEPGKDWAVVADAFQV